MTTQANTSTQPDADTTPKPGPAATPEASEPSGPVAAVTDAPAAANENPDDLSTTEPIEDGDGGNKAGREAAKYRRQLRDTEAERDTLTGTVETLRKQLINQNMPRSSSINSDALWKAGHAPAEMFKDDGSIDTEKLAEAAKATHELFGLSYGAKSVVRRSGDRSEDLSRPSGPTWGEALDAAK
ncbi:hypothetical protein [Arthrobacter oryzae]|uniref:Scaffolding protein n=1 Tax=Arthrobacter oryzae TaxID=409290 RepID=A0A3N0BRE8_9MICC|nr:hypothetical protein [Arthrobacter oryzae]RNL51582.1 hypothetical protein D7003_15755 [Arthrobacter oryzae]